VPDWFFEQANDRYDILEAMVQPICLAMAKVLAGAHHN
jgi:hypothetical protein